MNNNWAFPEIVCALYASAQNISGDYPSKIDLDILGVLIFKKGQGYGKFLEKYDN